MPRNRLPLLTIFFSLTLILAGCGTAARLARPMRQAGTALFTSATFADMELVGIKTGPVIPVEASPSNHLDETTLLAIGQLVTQGPVGVLLPITEVGQTVPWWIFCPAGDLQARCEEIPSNARVTFAGQPLGRGTVLLPTRLTWTER